MEQELRRNRSTLVFANSRRVVERLTRVVNEEAGAEVVYSHHGSLSREIRTVVEERLKEGRLRGIVATSSLELGIDIGTLDEVVLVQPPASVAAAVQRIGRAGHGVGQVSRGCFLALAPRELLEAAVAARAVLDGAIEPVVPVTGALDVLAQVLASMTATETWTVEELWAEVRRSDPYHGLPRRAFDLVLEMLAGRFSAARIRELRPVVSIDRVDGTVRGRPGAERLVYLAGGTIPDRGYFHLRTADTGALIGELDEEFVWERSVGDAFVLGVQSWRIERITHNDVIVRPARTRAAMAPFWRAEERDRGWELSERLALFLETADASLEAPAFREALEADYCLEPHAADALLRFLSEQKAATGGLLPHRHRLLVERVADPAEPHPREQIILHTLWGGRLNRPYALALAAAWERRHGTPLEVLHDNDCVVAIPPGGVATDELLGLVRADTLDELLHERLERSGLFGARFREAAGRALLLPREGFRRRTPLWLSRQRAKELLAAVSGFEDFPLVLEAWRSCLEDELDLAPLRRVLDEVADGRIEVRSVTTASPSPLAATAVWKRTNELMYADDTPSTPATRVRGDLVEELLFASHLRPRLSRALVATFQDKLQRTFPGYAPRDATELLDWVVERTVIPPPEWRRLLDAVARDGVADPGAALAALAGKVTAVTPPGADEPAFVAAVENLPRILAALSWDARAVRLTAADGRDDPASRRALAALAARQDDPADAGDDPLAELAADLLRFFGPVEPAVLFAPLGVAAERGREILAALAAERTVVADELTAGAPGPEVCDAANLERLLRLARAAARPEFEALPAETLPLFLATWQGPARPASGVDGLREALERLLGWPAPAELWETDILPARLDPYVPTWLDALLADTALEWVGAGPRRLAFTLEEERDLLREEAPPSEPGDAEDPLFPHPSGHFTFEELLAHSGLPSDALAKTLWSLAWRGAVSNDGFAAVRRGLEAGFAPALAAPPPTHAGGHRLRFERWRSTRPFSGTWYRLPPPAGAGDALDEEERNRERARLVLDRYGVVFRSLLEHELPALRWGRLFRSLRLMELSGEVLSGRFFAGVPGPQFASHEAFRLLSRGLPSGPVWWSCAADPASGCGLGVDGLELPARLPTTHLAFIGSRLALVSERRGRRLTLHVPPGHPLLREVLGVLRSFLSRDVRPMRAVAVETINGGPAASSPYREPLEELFHAVRDRTGLRLMRRY